MTTQQAADELHVTKVTIRGWLRRDWLARDDTGISAESVSLMRSKTPAFTLWRRNHGLTVGDVARLAGVSESTVYYASRGFDSAKVDRVLELMA